MARKMRTVFGQKVVFINVGGGRVLAKVVRMEGKQLVVQPLVAGRARKLRRVRR